MPYPGVPKSQTKKMEKQVKAIMSKGHSKSSAIAIALSQRKRK
jgi:hypothetical protein